MIHLMKEFNMIESIATPTTTHPTMRNVRLMNGFPLSLCDVRERMPKSTMRTIAIVMKVICLFKSKSLAP
ncbi:hypothetical protein EUGRSUZ_E01518 [Eucalyptus grandis]|uniref:Uncharacterized protein n=2 Tax=Eucalyptus grandis TaxID=71139 RepID=A0ACC3KWR3_EUCGR|nr:hypothetical protein EUGRSUZ_E01518 [Eucalyptus grandis]